MKIFYPKSTIFRLFGIFFFASILTPLAAQTATPGCQANQPANLTQTAITQTTASFSWEASNSNGGIGYNFEVRTSGTAGADNDPLLGFVTSGSTTNLSVTISGLNVDTDYMFYVRYQCETGNAGSTYASIAFHTLPLAAPVAVPAAFIEDDSFLAIWQSSEGATGYLLDVSTDSSFTDPNAFVVHTSLDESDNTVIDYTYNNWPTTNTSRIVTQLQPLTTYYYRVQAVAGSNTTGESNVITVTTTDIPPTSVTWTTGGWTSDPTRDLPATMAANFNSTTDGNIDALTLTINPGVTVQISSTGYAYVVNEITNNAGVNGLIIKTNANLVQENDVNNVGDITVQRASSPLYRLDYTMWSSPTSDGTTVDQTLTNFSPQTVNNRFYTLNTATNVFTTVDPFVTTFQEGKGYFIRMPNNHVINENSNPAQSWLGVFKGIPNNGDVTVPLSAAGNRYNLVGNPYPSVIAATDFIDLNADNIMGTLYFWRRTNNPDDAPYDAQNTYYATYTYVGGVATGAPSTSSATPLGFINAGQGFLVEAKVGATSLLFNNSLRTPSFQVINQPFFRNSAASTVSDLEKHRIWLNFTNEGGAFSQMLLGYVETATNGVDYGIDGKYIGDGGIALTSYLNNAEYTIQGRSLPFSPADIVPLNFRTPFAGNYSISISQVDGLFAGATGQDIFIKDNLLSTTHNLKESPYTFATEAGSFSDRFEIQYQNALGTANPVLSANNVVVYKNASDIVVNAGTITIASVKVFDIRGRLLVEKNNINASETTINAGSEKQVLIVQITSNDNITVSKKIVN